VTRTPIVVGIDGSFAASDAVRWAADEAIRRHRPLHIVSAALLSPGTFADGINLRTGIFGEQERHTRRCLAVAAELARDTAAGAPLTVDTILGHGSAADVLIQHSADADMVVVGSRGLGEFTGAVLGSVGTPLAAHAQCPVVIVKKAPAADRPATIGPIVVGVDGTANSEPAVRWAFDEASRRGTDVVAVHAWSDADVSAVAALTHAFPSPDNLQVAEEATLAECLAGYRESHPGVHVRRVVVHDNPARELIREAQDALMIVTGSRGRGGFSALLLGSTSRTVIHRARVTVVIVPTGRSTARRDAHH